MEKESEPVFHDDFSDENWEELIDFFEHNVYPGEKYKVGIFLKLTSKK